MAEEELLPEQPAEEEGHPLSSRSNDAPGKHRDPANRVFLILSIGSVCAVGYTSVTMKGGQSGMSIMLDAKNARKRAEADVQLLSSPRPSPAPPCPLPDPTT